MTVRYLSLIGLLVLGGCSHKHRAVSSSSPKPMGPIVLSSEYENICLGQHACKPAPPAARFTEGQILAGLNFEANKHHLRWNVVCIPAMVGEAQHYLAYTRYKTEPLGVHYVEDGAREYWWENGKTPLEAAYSLYLSIANNNPPNGMPDHKPIQTDCAYNSVYNSDHAGKIPCAKGKP